MANVQVKDASAATIDLATGSGAGSVGDPFVSPAASRIGAIADAAVTNPASSASVIAALKGLLTHLASQITLLAGGLPAALSGGGGVKVGVVDALPAGTNAIGKLSANSGVDIGDVDVTSLPAIPTGSNTIGAVTNVPLSDFGAGEYETVAASQTDQILGATGGVGDYLALLLIVPATTSPGNVLIQDGNGSEITVFAGGASSVSNLVPFPIPLGMKTVNATTPGWKVTTGANVSVIGIGNFT